MPLVKHVTGQKKSMEIKGSIGVNLGAYAKFFTWKWNSRYFSRRLSASGDSFRRPHSNCPATFPYL